MKSIFLISCLLICCLAEAQRPAKLYVYSQEFSPGTVPARNENGTAHAGQANTRYYIYFFQPNFTAIQFDRIRLENHWYKVTRVDTIGTPIYLKEPEKILLVPETRNLVLVLNPGEACSAPKGAPDLKKTGAEIIYRRKGQKFTISLVKIKSLPPVPGL